ncbi:chitin deacetylase 1 [Magnaporthiopsis poae ATCC 64411]|uniref:Chitin deacetylase 1 n=1 Tax=Magnaporthiopsis poae (strain ATCC 64411 / 73-15) TaxID=644358 RepID=A0A0C4EFE7_MAGP6|nr:chitin deacetylase 1 [Magnaporthiopsis poae ATCC 64411]
MSLEVALKGKITAVETDSLAALFGDGERPVPSGDGMAEREDLGRTTRQRARLQRAGFWRLFRPLSKHGPRSTLYASTQGLECDAEVAGHDVASRAYHWTDHLVTATSPSAASAMSSR